MEKTDDFVIGRDVVLEEYDSVSDLLSCLPLKAQHGAKSLMGQVHKLRLEHGVQGVKNLFCKVKETAQENLKYVKIEYNCFDASHDVVVLGTNLGVIFLFDRIRKHLSRLVIESHRYDVLSVKLLASHSLVAGGHTDGKISIFSFVLASQGYGKADSLQITSAHEDAITCFEWSPDGTVLYSGDVGGKIVMTVIKFGEVTSQTALLFSENSQVVQLSYSPTALLVSTHKRTVIWKYSGEKPIQIGQKERKIMDNFGACFYPPARQAEDTGDLQVMAFVARPGLRLWTASIDGTVSATLMYKGLVNENPPEIKALCPVTDSFGKAAGNQLPQFGRLLVYHGQFIVTWDKLRLWVLDTSPCSVVGYLDTHGPIVDVCTVGHEIFILRQSFERMVVRFSLIPKIPNPLIKILVVHDSSKEDTKNKENVNDPNQSRTEMELKETDLHLALNAVRKADKTLGTVSSAAQNDSLISRKAVAEQAATISAPSLTSRFDNIPEQDYGDIVYSKAKRKNRKKKRKNGETGKTRLVQGDIGPLQGEKIDLEPLLDDFSDVSSEFDVADRNESPVEQSSDQDPETAPNDSLLDTSSEQENVREHFEAESSSHDDSESKGHLRLPTELVTTDSTSSVDHVDSDFKSEDNLRRKEAAEQPILSGINKTKSDSSQEFESSNQPGTKRSSTPINIENKTCSPTSFEEYLSPPYLAKSFSNVYSSAEVNLSDMSLSSKSLDKSSGAAKKLIYSPPAHQHESNLTVVDSISEEPAAAQSPQTSAENTPPCVLDSDGAEELVDAASWQSSTGGSVSSRTLSKLDSGSLVASVDTLQSDTISAASQETLSDSQGSAKPNLRLLADSWADYAGPNQSTVQYLTVSDTHLWCITSNDSIFYCPTHFSVTSWTQLDGSARQIATNMSGDVIWCIDRKNYAYYRARVNAKHLTGREWCPVEKEMRFVAVDENCVWGIKMNGDVFVKTDVSRQQPQGKGWQTIKLNTGFVQASCLDGIVWFLDKKHIIHVYKGIGSVKPSNAENWEMLADVSAKWICLGVEGVAFIVDPKGSLWFTTNVTQANRTGGDWFQISLGQYLMQDAGVLESLWSWVRPEIKAVTQAPKELIESLWSWVKRGDEAKLISASPKAGLWVQGSQGSMHAVHGHLLGSRWDPATPTGVAQSVFWSYVSAGGYLGNCGHVWAVKPNGEMICYRPGGRSTTLEPPKGSVLKLLSVSGMSVWGIKHNFKVVQRAGISDLCPEGYRWVDVKLEPFDIGKVMHLSCGALSTWAVDESGQIWLRIGREEDESRVTQAWLPVEGKPLSGCRFAKVAVSPQDRVVWAVDDRNNVYARDKLTPSFPIGTSWVVVPGTGVKDICMSEHMVWATCPNGDIACRYGVSETNCVGDYWKKVPGNFELISVSPDDQLWAIDQNGQLFHRRTQLFYGTQAPLKPRSYSALFTGEDDWEFI